MIDFQKKCDEDGSFPQPFPGCCRKLNQEQNVLRKAILGENFPSVLSEHFACNTKTAPEVNYKATVDQVSN